MNRKSVIAFLLIVIVAVVLLYNMRGPGLIKTPSMDLNLVFFVIKGVYSSIVLLAFTIAGVLIGLFIK
jgi:hypothetical protein